MLDHHILGVHVTNRMVNSVEVQKVFAEYGCNIKTRLGLHDVDETSGCCSSSGLVILEIVGGDKVASEIAAKLGAIAGIQVGKMVFTHPE